MKRHARAKLPYEQINAFLQREHSLPLTTKKEVIHHLTKTVKELLRENSRLEFDEQYRKVAPTWPDNFRRYFDENLLPAIDQIGELS